MRSQIAIWSGLMLLLATLLGACVDHLGRNELVILSFVIVPISDGG